MTGNTQKLTDMSAMKSMFYDLAQRKEAMDFAIANFNEVAKGRGLPDFETLMKNGMKFSDSGDGGFVSKPDRTDC